MGVTTIDQKIAEFFNSNFNLGGDWPWGNLILCTIAVILSVLLCGAVGLEREKKGRSAGLRTHLLVGVGSCIVMIISIYGFPAAVSFNADGSSSRDVARLAAQVVTGVGFLGAGAIIHNQGGIKGLTTASTIWLVMAIGLACGSMNFVLAISCTLVVMVILVSFRRLERKVNRSNPMFVVISDASSPIMTNLLTIGNELHYTISDINSQMIQNGSDQCVEVTFKVAGENGKEVDVNELTIALEKTGSVKCVQVLNHH